MIVFPDETVNCSSVYQTLGHGHYGIVMTVGIDCLSEKGFGPFTHLHKPIGWNQFSGVGLGVGEGENTPPEIPETVNGAVLVDDQIGVVEMTSENLGSCEEFEAVFFSAGGVRA